MTSERSERVFISYSHESPLHAGRVLELAQRLRQEGVDAWIDRYESYPAQGWPRWMQERIESSAFVLAVCSPTYCRRFEGKERPGQGLGAAWEGQLASQMLYEAGGQNERLVPVLFEGGDGVVPTMLRPYTRYRLPDEYEGLYRRLTNQPEVVPTLLGPLRALPRTHGVAKAARPALPAIPPSGPGVPDPAQLDSPFVVGPPIEKIEQFFGRGRQLDEIRYALRERQPIQIVGETRMGKTSLLNRVPDLAPKDRAVARINAQGRAGSSPRELGQAIAASLGRQAEFDRAMNGGGPAALLAGFDQLMPCTVLVDEAEALAREGHGFDRDFFDHCRTLCQNHRLIWVSAAHSDLEGLFAAKGLTSRFLNDSKKVYVGQLDSAAADDLVSVLGQCLATRARHEAGALAMGLQWLGHAFWQDGDRALVTDHFANAMQVVFPRWWERLDQEERRLLKRSAAGVAVSSLGDRERRTLAALVQRGLANQEDGVFLLPGAAWRSFVVDAY